MKNLLLLLLLFITSLFADKANFSVVIKQPFNAALFDITENYNRTISAVGFSKEFKKTTSTSNTYDNAFDYLSRSSGGLGAQMHILSIDNKAHLLLSKEIKFSHFSKAVSVLKTAENGYFIGGYTLDGSLVVLKLDAHAHLLFRRVFGTKNYDRMNNLILLSDGGVLSIGSSMTSRSKNDAMFTTGLGKEDLFLTRFSKDGRKLWSKKYGTLHDDKGIDAVEALDGSIMVISITSYGKKSDATLMRITENGDTIWYKKYRESTKSTNVVIPKKIIRLNNNNFLVVFTQYNGMNKEHIRLVEFDLYENILLDKEIFTTYSSEINDIKEYLDGRFIAVGYVKDNYNSDGLVMILDADLLLLNQEHYGGENYDTFNAVKILHNSQSAIAGLYTEKNSQETHMWITKVNPDASMVQLATKSSNLYDKLSLLFKKEIDEKKIILKKNLSLLLTDKALSFPVGKSKLNQKQKKFLKKFDKKLIPFLYANRKTIQTVEIGGHTSHEWKGVNFSQEYLNNAKLSLQRSFETLSYLFQHATKQEQKWLVQVSKGSGYSYSKEIEVDGREDKKASRRISFSIILRKI